jgi:hypothetical protein
MSFLLLSDFLKLRREVFLLRKNKDALPTSRQKTIQSLLQFLFCYKMTKQQIIQLLRQKHNAFIAYIQTLSAEEFLYAPEGKWAAAQQLDHIHKSVKPLTQAMGYPKFIPRLLFGKANRPSKTYDALINRYNEKLSLGGRASGRFVPPVISTDQKDALIKLILNSVNNLCKRIEKFSETELDNLILPHPLLGKITIREMMYFTAYHVEHHENIIKRDLKNK